MNINYLVEIGLDHVDDATIGCIDNKLMYSLSQKTGYYTGFLSKSSISNIADSCNILYGGELGGITSEVEINIHSSELVELLDSGDINLRGCNITIKVDVDDTTQILLYQGKIFKFFADNTLTVSVGSRPVHAVDSAPVPYKTLSTSNNFVDESLSGKVVTTSYGAVQRYKLIPIDQTVLQHAVIFDDIMYDDNGVRLYQTSHSHEYDMDPLAVNSVTQGIMDLQVFKKADIDGDGKCWIALSADGKSVYFRPESLIFKNFAITAFFKGKRLKVVNGSHKDAFWYVTGVKIADVDGVNTVWLRVNAADADVESANGYSMTTTSSTYVSQPMKIDTWRGHQTTTGSFLASYQDSNVKLAEIDYVSMMYNETLFICHQKAFFYSGSKLIVIKDGVRYRIDNKNMSVVYSDDNVKIISVEFIESNNKQYAVNSYVDLPTYYVENAVGNVFGIDNVIFTQPSGEADGAPYGADILAAHVSENFYKRTFEWYGTTFTNFEAYNRNGKFTANDFKNSSVISFLPVIDFFIADPYNVIYPNENYNIYITINQKLIRKGGTVIGEVESATTYNFSPGASTMQLMIDIGGDIDNPIYTYAAVASDNCLDFPSTTITSTKKVKSYDAARVVCENLNMQSLLESVDINSIQGVTTSIRAYCVQLRMINDTQPVFVGGSVNKSMMYVGVEVNKNEILLESKKYDGAPEKIVQEICTSNSITSNIPTYDTTYATSMTASYNCQSDDTVSTMLASIAKGSNLGLYKAPNNTLYVRNLLQLTSEPTSAYTFDGANIKNGSTYFSSDTTNYMSSLYNLKIDTDYMSFAMLLSPKSSLGTLDDYTLGSTTYVDGVNGVSIYINGRSSKNFIKFTIASAYSYIKLNSTWKLTRAGNPIVQYIKINAIMNDPTVITTKSGYFYSFVVLREQTLSSNSATTSMTICSSVPTKYEFMPVEYGGDSAIATTLNSTAYNTLNIIGDGVKARNMDYNWDIVADKKEIVNVFNAHVRYQSIPKIVVRFTSPLNQHTLGLMPLTGVTFNHPRYTTTVPAIVVGREINVEDAEIEFTLCIFGDAATEVSYVLTENSVPIFTENNLPVSQESDLTPDGVKMSEFISAEVESVINAGSYLPTIIPNTTNNKILVGDVVDYAIDKSKEYTDSVLLHGYVYTGGVIGDTTVIIPHTLGTKNLIVSAYSVEGGVQSLVSLGIDITPDSFIIADLAPLTENGQIKLIAIKV